MDNTTDGLTRRASVKVREEDGKLEMTEEEIAEATVSIARSQQAIGSNTRCSTRYQSGAHDPRR